MSIYTRYANIDDAEKISKLLDLYRAFYGEKSDYDKSLNFIKERIYLGESHIILAIDENEVIGFVQLFPSFSSVTLQRLWILNDLYVLEKYRSQGVGLQLLFAAKKFAFDADAKQIFIEGAVENVKARQIYEKFGFIENSEYKYYHLPLNG